MTSKIRDANGSSRLIWTGRILSALPVLLMLVTAILGLAKPGMAEKGMRDHGFLEGSARPIILVELACVILYVVPQTAVLGAVLLTGYLGGATATHVRVGEPFFMPVIVGVVVWLGLVFRDRRLRSLLPFHSV